VTPEQLKSVFTKSYSRLLILAIIGVCIAIGVLVGHRIQEDHNTARKVVRWKVQYGYLITNLTKDFENAESASQAGDATSLATDCQQIHRDAVAAESKPTIPDAAVKQSWNSALHDDAAGATDCIMGLSQSKASLMKQATTDFSNATKALTAVSTDLQHAATIK
jgi:hypothetical protein